MNYPTVIEATFLRRPNRFIAVVSLNGDETVVHVKNTGRCKELLQPGNRVFLSESASLSRKTRYDLIAVEKNRDRKAPLLINMDSQIPNDAVAEWLPHSGLFSSDAIVHREWTWRHSRFDFHIEDAGRKALLEVKGVTLEQDGIAAFPDAPTERGVKHIHELMDSLQEDYEAYILFVIQMSEIRFMRPNDSTHPAFGEALRLAARRGVHVLAMDCVVTPHSIHIHQPIPVSL